MYVRNKNELLLVVCAQLTSRGPPGSRRYYRHHEGREGKGGGDFPPGV